MRVTRRVLINSIAFVLLGLLLALVFAIQILPTVFGKSYSIYGIFPEAGGVFTNQEVTYRGVQVGRVGDMTLTRDAVKIEIKIGGEYKIPREGTRARILFKSAVGEQFIDILPDRIEPPYFQEGDLIPASLTSIPIQTEDLLRDLNAVLATIDPTALATVVNELGQGLSNHGPDLKELILALDTLSQIGANRKDLIASGTTAGADLQSAFLKSKEDFVKAADALAVVAKVLANRRAQLGQTLDNTEVLDREILLLLKNRKPELDNVIADAATATRLTYNQRDDLDKVLQYIGPALGDVYKAYSAPYFIFNLLSASPADICSYSTSSRPVRAVNDTGFKEPQTNFKCTNPAISPQNASARTPPVPDSPVSPFTEIEQKRVPWLRLYTFTD
jgi:phospholipid/cholesterol/gamma-HCH transport system substrate-binding protein